MPTKIEWCDEVFNPITGCTPISEGCSRCYAARMAKRLANNPKIAHPEKYEGFKIASHPDRLYQPNKWKKPRRIFVCSMGDLFHDDVPGEWINLVWNVAFNNPRHTFMFLTKRPGNLKKWTEEAANAKGWPIEEIWPSWMWLGVTAENQKRADERIPILLDIPAAIHFVSIEPMLGPVDLYKAQCKNASARQRKYNIGFAKAANMLDLTICGGETGGGARPMHPDWAYGLRDQCKKNGTPFFFKSGGEWSLKKPFPACAWWMDEDGLKWWRVGKGLNEIHYKDMPREFPEVESDA